MSTYNRLTVEEVDGLIKKHNFELVFGPYGLVKNPEDSLHRKACAFGMTILRHTDDADAARELLWSDSVASDRIRKVSEEIQIPFEYLGGLIWGFECPDRYMGSGTTGDRMLGFEDGLAIRKFALAQSVRTPL